jgi:UDP-3-O-[3-hydroxymyristoyl] glucosamine N-acyltransferase
MLLSEAAGIAGGTVVCDGEFQWLGKVRDHRPGLLTFAETARWARAAVENQFVTCIALWPGLEPEVPDGIGVLVSPDPRRWFFDLHEALCHSGFYGLPSETYVDPSVQIGVGAHIDVRGVRIGPNCIIETGAFVLSGSTLAEGCRIRTGAIIGSEGFEVRKRDGELRTVPHVGETVLEAGVEVQHYSCVDRAPFGRTVIGEQTKIDNLCHIGHGCHIGARNIVTAGVTFGGNVVTGDDCWFGIHSVIRDGRTVGDRGRVTMGACATQDVAPGETVSGNWALPHDLQVRHMKAVRSNDDDMHALWRAGRGDSADGSADGARVGVALQAVPDSDTDAARAVQAPPCG